MALSIMKKHPEKFMMDESRAPHWDYVHAPVLTSFEELNR